MKGSKVFVTGPLGLLGPWLIEELLREGASVIALVRDQAGESLFYQKKLHEKTTVIAGDLCDYQLLVRILNEFDIDTIFHIGAQAIVGVANRSPLSTFESNIRGSWNLFEAARYSPWVKKIIVASSDKAYGEQPVLPYTEEMPLQGRHPYDVSKSCTDLIAQTYFHTYKLPICITRCGNFFGGGDLHFNRIVPGTIRSLLQGKRPIVRSDGTLIRDYIYVKDVAHAYILLAKKMDDEVLHGQAFNFSTDQPYSVLEMIQKIACACGVNNADPIVQNSASNEIAQQSLCSKKARDILGWQPAYGLDAGLQETYGWYKEYFDTINSSRVFKRAASREVVL